MSAAAQGAAPAPAWPWWAVGVGLLAVAFAGVLTFIVATYSGGERFGSAPALAVNGAAFKLTRGDGHADRTSFVLVSTQDGIAALSAEIAPFAADKYPRVEWSLRTAQSPAADLAFVWRTREHPGRTFTKPLRWAAGRIAPLQMDANDGWRGTITGVALVVRGSLPAPLEVDAVRLPSATVRATLAETFAQWAAPFPLKGYAIAFPFDAERLQFFPVAKALGVAVGLAIVAYLAVARWRGRPVDARVPWAIFAAAWILLDVRWQANLGREVLTAAERYGGRTGDEKLLAAEDAVLFALAQDIKKALPPPPVRLLVLCDSSVIALRVAHFLYPHNVSRNLRARRYARTQVIPPDRATLRSGDAVVLVFYSGLGYDAARGALVWPDGGTIPVEVVLSKPDALVVRVR